MRQTIAAICSRDAGGVTTGSVIGLGALVWRQAAVISALPRGAVVSPPRSAHLLYLGTCCTHVPFGDESLEDP